MSRALSRLQPVTGLCFLLAVENPARRHLRPRDPERLAAMNTATTLSAARR